MSKFAVPVIRVRAIEPILGADAIELAVVGDYRSVVKKDAFKPGDLAVYLPEGSVLPEALMRERGFWNDEKNKGMFDGPEGTRLRARRLRGCLSQGVLLAIDVADAEIAAEGADMAEALGVVKYEPPIPTSMSGECAALYGVPLKYDIENIKAYPDVFWEGEPVEMTEKAHGTFCGVAVVPGLDHSEMFGGDGVVYSKGLGAKGLVFKDNEANAGNIYVQAAKRLDLHARIRSTFPGRTVHLLGEVYGAGVQDLHYGRKDRGFMVFDIQVDGEWVSPEGRREVCVAMGLHSAPPLYIGPFSKAVMLEYTDGKTVVGGGAHMREGVVVRPLAERRDDAIGRVILKSVSADYLLRRGATTEFG